MILSFLVAGLKWFAANPEDIALTGIVKRATV